MTSCRAWYRDLCGDNQLDRAEMPASTFDGRDWARLMSQVRYAHAMRNASPSAIDWLGTFGALVSDSGPFASDYLKLIATTRRSANLVVDGRLLSEFRDQIENFFPGSRPMAVARPRADRLELIWRPHPEAVCHWGRGRDGSVAFVTTLGSPHARDHVSLWEMCIDVLCFVELARDLCPNTRVSLLIDFQPGTLLPTGDPLAPAHVGKPGLRQLRRVQRAKPRSEATYTWVSEDFAQSELRFPFRKIASLLADRWIPMFGVQGLRVDELAQDLETMATAEVGWKPPFLLTTRRLLGRLR